MKQLLFIFLFAGICSTVYSQDATLTAEEKQELLQASPFNSVYPSSILKSADEYFKAQMGLYKEGVIAEKRSSFNSTWDFCSYQMSILYSLSYF